MSSWRPAGFSCRRIVRKARFLATGEKMTIARFVFAYEQSRSSLILEAESLRSRIKKIESRGLLAANSRLATRLSLYRYQLDGIEQRNSGASLWLLIVVEPIFQVLQKHLGKSFHGALSQPAPGVAKLRFACTSPLTQILELTLRLSEPEPEPLSGAGENILEVHRSIYSQMHDSPREETIPIGTRIKDIAAPLQSGELAASVINLSNKVVDDSWKTTRQLGN